jgi:hypothetical protein
MDDKFKLARSWLAYKRTSGFRTERESLLLLRKKQTGAVKILFSKLMLDIYKIIGNGAVIT